MKNNLRQLFISITLFSLYLVALVNLSSSIKHRTQMDDLILLAVFMYLVIIFPICLGFNYKATLLRKFARLVFSVIFALFGFLFCLYLFTVLVSKPEYYQVIPVRWIWRMHSMPKDAFAMIDAVLVGCVSMTLVLYLTQKLSTREKWSFRSLLLHLPIVLLAGMAFYFIGASLYLINEQVSGFHRLVFVTIAFVFALVHYAWTISFALKPQTPAIDPSKAGRLQNA